MIQLSCQDIFSWLNKVFLLYSLYREGGFVMELKDRISTIIKENQLKQKELAALVGVTESYISTLL